MLRKFADIAAPPVFVHDDKARNFRIGETLIDSRAQSSDQCGNETSDSSHMRH